MANEGYQFKPLSEAEELTELQNTTEVVVIDEGDTRKVQHQRFVDDATEKAIPEVLSTIEDSEVSEELPETAKVLVVDEITDPDTGDVTKEIKRIPSDQFGKGGGEDIWFTIPMMSLNENYSEGSAEKSASLTVPLDELATEVMLAVDSSMSSVYWGEGFAPTIYKGSAFMAPGQQTGVEIATPAEFKEAILSGDNVKIRLGLQDFDLLSDISSAFGGSSGIEITEENAPVFEAVVNKAVTAIDGTSYDESLRGEGLGVAAGFGSAISGLSSVEGFNKIFVATAIPAPNMITEDLINDSAFMSSLEYKCASGEIVFIATNI